MTVGKLIEVLEKQPKDMDVYIHNNECSDGISRIFVAERTPENMSEKELDEWNNNHNTDAYCTGEDYFESHTRVDKALCLYGNDY